MTEASMTNSNMTAPISTPQPVVDSTVTPKTDTPVTVDMTNVSNTVPIEETTTTEVKKPGFDTGAEGFSIPTTYIQKYMPSNGLQPYNINENGDESSYDYNNINDKSFKYQYLRDAENRKIFETMQEKRNYFKNTYPNHIFFIKEDKLYTITPDFRCALAEELEK